MIEYFLDDDSCSQFNFWCEINSVNPSPFKYGLKYDIPEYDSIEILHDFSMVTGFKFFYDRNLVASVGGVRLIDEHLYEQVIMTKTLDFGSDQTVLGLFTTKSIEGK